MSIGTAYYYLFTCSLCILAALLLMCFARAVKGPRLADRIVAINMMGTQVIVIICILALMLKQGYLADVAIIYAMISFLSVVVLCKIYLGVYWSRKEREEGEKDERRA